MFIEHIPGIHAMTFEHAKHALWMAFFRAYNFADVTPDRNMTFDEATEQRAIFDAGYEEDLKTLERWHAKSANI